MQAEIDRLQRDVDAEDSRDNTEEGSSSAEEMAANLNVFKADLKSLQSESIRLDNSVSDLKLETKALESKMGTLKTHQERLLNIDNQKLEIMRERVPQGKDASEAAQWLENNQDKFQGNVYKPILMNINVNDPAASMYLGEYNYTFLFGF